MVISLAYIYLDALNTQGQFKPSSETTPTTVGNVLLTRGRAGRGGGLDLGLPAVALGRRHRGAHGRDARLAYHARRAGRQLVVFASLKAPLPLHAYASSIGLFILFHAWHLVAGLVIGAIVLGRLYKGRIGGREYVIQVVGYWLWYAAIVSVVLMVLTLAIN